MRALRPVTFALLFVAGAANGPAALAQSVTRGPYLQTGTPTSVVVRWRTSVATNSRVRYGSAPGSLTSWVDDAQSTTEHQVTVSGLAADTPYYYSVGTTTTTLAGNDTSHFFVTSPAAGTPKPTRIWVLGDSGTADANAAAVRNAYYTFTGTRHTDLWLMLGDNAYSDGTDSEYQSAVFNMYPTMLRKSVLWPTLGNHDGHTADSATQTGPYYNIFTLPTQGQAGGVASGTEAYYSFDYGNIHFVCLESYETDRSTSGAMLTWLQQDLAATTQPWIIAFWHHPPYSKGSHDSDSETQLVQMRQNALPILESYGVDLVLCGHSHSYERSFLIDGHYGSSGTFTQAHKKDGGSGQTTGSGAYLKPTFATAPNEGAVYAVAGSSGKTEGGSLNHPAMFVSLNVLGSMVLDVDGNRLDARFLDNAGVSRDTFTLIKGPQAAPPAASTSLSANRVSGSQVNLAWIDNATNELEFRIERSTDGVTFAQVAAVGANLTTYSDTGLSSGTTYYYRVRAHNTAGDSAYSNIAPPPPSVPNAPSSLTATAVSASQINLSWTDNANNEDGFKVERSTDGVTFTEIAQLGANATSYASTGLAASMTYTYRVRAFNAAGNSSYSNTASATTLAAPAEGDAPDGPPAPRNTASATTLAAPSVPNARSSLTATAVSRSQINLAWTNNSGNETGFRIERSRDQSSWSQIATTAANVTSYSNTSLSRNTRYYYRVRATNASGDSAYSNTANARTLRR